MKKIYIKLLFGFGLLCPIYCMGLHPPGDSLEIYTLLEETEKELAGIYHAYEFQTLNLLSDITKVNQKLENASILSTKIKLELLLEKSRLQDDLKKLQNLYDLKLEQTRYLKGIELIKMMYEKILGLDHHFTSLQTHQGIMEMSNPNSYPEFQEAKTVIRKRLKKKDSVSLPNVLMSNPFLTASYSLVASFFGDSDTKRKEADLEKIACIMDFTVRMNADLSLIYYETEYLKESNKSLMKECKVLFENYTKIIDYHVSLDKCRRTDDWESIEEGLSVFIKDLEAGAAINNEIMLQKVHKGVVNLEFSVDRLLDFLNKYSSFIAQGEKYYQKFHVIVSNYQNEVACAGKLPHEFATLKQNISLSIEKFNNAYNIAELKGSKLKDLLYGYD